MRFSKFFVMVAIRKISGQATKMLANLIMQNHTFLCQDMLINEDVAVVRVQVAQWICDSYINLCTRFYKLHLWLLCYCLLSHYFPQVSLKGWNNKLNPTLTSSVQGRRRSCSSKYSVQKPEQSKRNEGIESWNCRMLQIKDTIDGEKHRPWRKQTWQTGVRHTHRRTGHKTMALCPFLWRKILNENTNKASGMFSCDCWGCGLQGSWPTLDTEPLKSANSRYWKRKIRLEEEILQSFFSLAWENNVLQAQTNIRGERSVKRLHILTGLQAGLNSYEQLFLVPDTQAVHSTVQTHTYSALGLYPVANSD